MFSVLAILDILSNNSYDQIAVFLPFSQWEPRECALHGNKHYNLK